MPRARLVSHPTLVPLGQPEKAMGHESQIEPWLAPDNRVLLVGLRTGWPRRKEAMKTTGRETHNRYTTARSVPRSRSGSREPSCSIGTSWTTRELRPQVKCLLLTPFIELLRSWPPEETVSECIGHSALFTNADGFDRVQGKRLNRTMHQSAENPSRHVIFLPSS